MPRWTDSGSDAVVCRFYGAKISGPQGLAQRGATEMKRFAVALIAVVLLSLGRSAQSHADVRVDVHLRTPRVDVHVGSHDRCLAPRPLPPAARTVVVLDRTDRKIARALAYRTDYRVDELLAWRRAGYSWREVGAILKLSPHRVQAVLHRHHADMRPVVCRADDDRDHHHGHHRH